MLDRVFKSWSVIEPSTNKKSAPVQKSEQLLPNQISAKILDLQMQCDNETISKKVVFDLTAEYTKAVQFYQEQGNQKYKLYQKRMQKFLSRPAVASILNGQSGELVIKKQRNEDDIRKAQKKVQNQIKQLIQKHQQKQKKHEDRIKHQLSRQQQKLEQRIRNKRAISNKSCISEKSDAGGNNQESGKKGRQVMDNKMVLLGIDKRQNVKKVFL